ncbi:pirin family protein [Halorussus sp. MSC15.2]|uniref:pirin family protein n=1 Tax=Halorussus sp. MSC15.2 TaxID=2283638 RepID=UPI0013D17247|nr:pirin family protein [Halorussus sp. MSC15.2]NEU55583.1 pirin family protein [Halorussus sp. MSC15.2]
MNQSDRGGANPSGPLPGGEVRHGTGVHSNRAFPTDDYPYNLDPFVLFERFYIDSDEGFPMHPHRGFEIVSYMLDGGMEHEDSLGVSNTADEGDVMRITTGSGIRHSEFPARGSGCNGLQLWVNLPREAKDADPDYVDADAADLPTEGQDGATVTTVVGNGSPIELHTPMEYLDVSVSDSWSWSIPDEWTGFLYGVSGDGTVDGDAFTTGDVLPMTDARDVELRSEDSLRVVAISGRPHDEPIRQRGPFVL